MGISIGLHLDLRKTKDYMYPNGLSIFALNPSSPLSHPVCGLLSNNTTIPLRLNLARTHPISLALPPCGLR